MANYTNKDGKLEIIREKPFKLEKEIQKLESGKGLINISDPQIIELRQWWRTEREL